MIADKRKCADPQKKTKKKTVNAVRVGFNMVPKFA